MRCLHAHARTTARAPTSGHACSGCALHTAERAGRGSPSSCAPAPSTHAGGDPDGRHPGRPGGCAGIPCRLSGCRGVQHFLVPAAVCGAHGTLRRYGEPGTCCWHWSVCSVCSSGRDAHAHSPGPHTQHDLQQRLSACTAAEPCSAQTPSPRLRARATRPPSASSSCCSHTPGAQRPATSPAARTAYGWACRAPCLPPFDCTVPAAVAPFAARPAAYTRGAAQNQHIMPPACTQASGPLSSLPTTRGLQRAEVPAAEWHSHCWLDCSTSSMQLPPRARHLGPWQHSAGVSNALARGCCRP